MKLGVHGLMVEVDRTHRERLYHCSHSFSGFYPFPESFLSIETVFDYGFDKVNLWERWQLMLLYRDLFALQHFHAGEMLAARRSADRAALQRYFEGVVDTRMYWNKYKTSLLFLNLREGINWEATPLPLCCCFGH